MKAVMRSRDFAVCLLLLVGLASVPFASANDSTADPPSSKFDSVVVDSLDAEAWNGIVFAAKAFGQSSSFALRFGSFSGTFVEGMSILDTIREVGPHAPDGSYCRVSWEVPPRAALVTLEWSRLDETTVLGRITAERNFQTVLETYIPFAGTSWGLPGVFSVVDDGRAIAGERYFDGVFGRASQFMVMIDRPAMGSGTFPSLEELRLTMRGAGILVDSVDSDPSRNAAGLQFTTDNSKTAHFVALLGWDRGQLTREAKSLLAPGKIDSILQQRSESYAARRPSSKGIFEAAAEIIGNNMFWNTLYAPQDDLIFPSISRSAAQRAGGWVLGAWDGFFGSLLTSLEDHRQSWETIRAILLAQTETGLIPNAIARGITPDRSQPPVGAYAVWKVYEREPDREMLAWAYPRLKRWHEWWFKDRGDGQPWRDGNRDGLLEWGSNRGSGETSGGRGFLMQAKWESGMDDSPMWDDAHYDPKTYTMDLNDVGLNSLYALDAESLANLAGILGKDEDRRAFQQDYERVRQLVRDRLWNEADGIYENRFWNGQFSKRLSPTNFYPMLAGIATAEQAQRMVKEHLLNPREFWGHYVVPTTARSDPAFSDQYYWRGSIWGPTNYLLYHAIDRYGFDKVALEFAAKSYALFMDDWKVNQHNDELYHAWGGSGGGDTHYTWGALLCLIALEQFIDENPWDGLRFGALNPDIEGTFRAARWNGHNYEVRIGPQATEMWRDGAVRFHADAGVVVRSYTVSPSSLSMKVTSEHDFRATTAEFASGRLLVRLDGQTPRKIAVSNGTAVWTIPQGKHDVMLSLAR
jgi:hypothetical protein